MKLYGGDFYMPIHVMDSCDTDLPICDTSPILQSVMIHMVNKFMV
ncbi:hypothetical protein VCR31J2_1310287 [Vibrio coralliirubri]|uniref:Uncharacterized protein n=1 Tax=Vibrio coralliirubri TaxID=1516159 RepID=A0AA86XLZ9_9VIBR|nr:hypothetical protein VCR31J2_1310287 [Vibrio coralliirubri]